MKLNLSPPNILSVNSKSVYSLLLKQISHTTIIKKMSNSGANSSTQFNNIPSDNVPVDIIHKDMLTIYKTIIEEHIVNEFRGHHPFRVSAVNGGKWSRDIYIYSKDPLKFDELESISGIYYWERGQDIKNAMEKWCAAYGINLVWE